MGYNSYPTSKGEGKESVMFKFQAEKCRGRVSKSSFFLFFSKPAPDLTKKKKRGEENGKKTIFKQNQR